MLKNIKTIIFDLDGTLLPMDQDEFLEYYFYYLTQAFPKVNPQLLIDSLQAGVKKMIKNDGRLTNEKVFWQEFGKTYPVNDKTEKEFESFYLNEFQNLKNYTPADPIVKDAINELKAKGKTLICCTNPLFPQVATYSRITWAGLNPEDFAYITTYENSSFCKPNINYYLEVINKFKLDPSTCLMVGNDVEEDLITSTIGMKTYLINNHIINKRNLAIKADFIGSRLDFLEFVKTID